MDQYAIIQTMQTEIQRLESELETLKNESNQKYSILNARIGRLNFMRTGMTDDPRLFCRKCYVVLAHPDEKHLCKEA